MRLRAGAHCVHLGDQLSVGAAGSLQVLVAFLKLAGEVYNLLLQRGDASLELFAVGGGTEP